MSLTNTTGRLRYVAPLLLIVAVAACSKQDEAAPATTPAAATPTPHIDTVFALVKLLEQGLLQQQARLRLQSA